MGFFSGALLLLLLAGLAAAALAYAFGRRDSAGVERFVSDRAAKYDIASTVAVVAAYKEVFGRQPEPQAVRDAYDDIAALGTEVTKKHAARFFRDQKAASDPPPEDDDHRDPPPPEDDGDHDNPPPEDDGDHDNPPPEDGDHHDPPPPEDDGHHDPPPPEDGRRGPEGGDGPPNPRDDPFLQAVAAELGAVGARISALSQRVRTKARGAAPFSPGSRLRAIPAGAGPPPFDARRSTPAPSGFEGRDNDAAADASLRLADPGSAQTGPVEGFYAPW